LIRGFTAFSPAAAFGNEGFQESFFGELSRLEEGSFWFNARNRLIVWAMTKYFPRCTRFLEIGCGTGFVLSGIRSAFPSAELTGSEILGAGLEIAAKRVPSASFYQMDARSIPFRDYFDVVGAFDVLEHIVEDELVLAEISQAVRPGGGLLLSVPQHRRLWSRQDERAYHVRRYAAAELRRKVVAAGFEVVRMTSFVALLLPALFASRTWMNHRLAADAFDPIATLRRPRPVNVALGAVMAGERAMIRSGLSFPAGGSLLLVARKVEARS
jgi:SAM-dependent methyltransferase